MAKQTQQQNPYSAEDIVQAREAFSGDTEADDGTMVPFVVSPSEIFSGDHELVQRYPHHFRHADAHRPSVERATRAPGERR